MVLRSKDIAKKYNCDVFKDNGFDDSHKFWVAHENESDDMKFVHADGWTLAELVENIETEIMISRV
jgi:hypothetical protein